VIAGLVEHELRDLDPALRQRLGRCTKWLERALDHWCCGRVVDVTIPILLAAATQDGAVMIAANAWPAIDYDKAATIDRLEILKTAAAFIERSGNAEVVACSWCCIQGRAGMAREQAKAAQAKAAGLVPLCVLLIERREDSTAYAAMTLPLSVKRAGALH
jgi:hypothetical protein